MIRRLVTPLAPPLLLALLVAGCAGAPRPGGPATERPADLHEAGLERVVGRTARDLVALFGPADLDSREGQARRLQFVGPACVLDAYLYPDKGSEPTVTYLDTRRRDGDDIDRASCVAALARRDAAK
ncbi:hypothetical protein [Sphingomonas sp.]|uniref:hypothetical protein n=1 Tax=Sphingomonas sp. TaxID=28214 RepID=UPI003B000CCB